MLYMYTEIILTEVAYLLPPYKFTWPPCCYCKLEGIWKSEYDVTFNGKILIPSYM